MLAASSSSRAATAAPACRGAGQQLMQRPRLGTTAAGLAAAAGRQQQHHLQQLQQQQQARRGRTRVRAIEEKRDTAGSEADASPDMLSPEQLAKLAELRRQRADTSPQISSNVVQGALEEAQLITWPTPGKALLDTVLVLGIVAVTGALLFSLNVLLADASNWWYTH